MLKITKGQQGQSLKYVVDSLLLLVDSYACAIYVRESWFFIVVFVCVSFFHTQALEDNQEKKKSEEDDWNDEESTVTVVVA